MVDHGNGNIKYYTTVFTKYGNHRNLHRNIGPAEIFGEKTNFWFFKNRGHRNNGPFTNDITHWKSENKWHYKNKRSCEETYWNA